MGQLINTDRRGNLIVKRLFRAFLLSNFKKSDDGKAAIAYKTELQLLQKKCEKHYFINFLSAKRNERYPSRI